ncbi:MAG TPA: hypothetical protein VJX30_03145 [Terriglobales bacterium]|nr:hypothetical protein [Terriglobales bacterium]
MKLAVTRCDGDTEIIVLRDPVKVYEGTSQAHIQSAEGMDHYFRLSDGHYDGWAWGPPGGCTQEQAKTYIGAMQRERRIIPVSIRNILKQRLHKVWWSWRCRWGRFTKEPGF